MYVCTIVSVLPKAVYFVILKVDLFFRVSLVLRIMWLSWKRQDGRVRLPAPVFLLSFNVLTPDWVSSKYYFITLPADWPLDQDPGMQGFILSFLLELSDENIIEFWILVLQKTVLKTRQHKMCCVPSSPLAQLLLVCRVLTLSPLEQLKSECR